MTLDELEAQPLKWAIDSFQHLGVSFETDQAWRFAVRTDTAPSLRLIRYTDRREHGALMIQAVAEYRVPLDEVSAAGQSCVICGRKIHERKMRGVTAMGHALHRTCLVALDVPGALAEDLLMFAEEVPMVRTWQEVLAARGRTG